MNRREWIVLSGTAVLGLAGRSLFSQDRDHHDHDEHSKFDDHDREAMRGWYRDHHDHPPKGFRDDDRLPDDLERRLEVGFVLTPEYRRRIVAVPGDLYRRLPPPPRHYRYVIIGRHIVLIDDGWHIHDIVHFELNF